MEDLTRGFSPADRGRDGHAVAGQCFDGLLQDLAAPLAFRGVGPVDHPLAEPVADRHHVDSRARRQRQRGQELRRLRSGLRGIRSK